MVPVELASDRAVGVGPLVDLEPQMTRHERLRHLQEDVVQVVAVLAADLVAIAKAAGGEQRGGRALAFDDGVGHQRGAMDDRCNCAGLDPGGVQRFAQDGRDRGRGIRRRGQRLADRERPGLVVDEDQVGKGATDVDADAVPAGAGHGHGGYQGVRAGNAADNLAVASGPYSQGIGDACRVLRFGPSG